MIQGLSVKKIRDFRGGRIANQNPATMPENHGTIARDVFFLGDGVFRRRKGYTKVADAQAFGKKLARGFDFERQTDKKQFVLLTGSGKIAYMSPDGSGYHELSTTEDGAAVWDFIASEHTLYMGNGVRMIRLVDPGDGSLQLRNWGLQPMATAPTIAIGAGTLTLEFGRQYVICPVERWTDSQGVSRYHIGSPSPISAHTGPLTNDIVTLGSIPAVMDSNPNQTHWWIFSTMDTPFDTASFFAFAAEITIGTTSWGDTLSDDQLDSTRSAPWENLAPPASSILQQYQNRVVASVLNVAHVSGFEEIDLGDPLQAFPAALQFPVPGGVKTINGGAVVNQQGTSMLLLSCPSYFFQITGSDRNTLQKRDKVISPGMVGKKAGCVLPGWFVYVGVDKKLWAWDGYSSEPVELALKIGQTLIANVLTLDDMSDSQLSNIEVLYFGWGKYFWILVLCSTQNNGSFDWVQLWDGSNLARGSYADSMSQTAQMRMAESDLFFSDPISTAWVQQVNNTQFIFLGDTAGNVFRFPDGNTDNGSIIRQACFGTVPLELDEPEITKEMKFVDIMTNRADAATAFRVAAVSSNGLVSQNPVGLRVFTKPDPPQDPSVLRADMLVRGASVGTWTQVVVFLPDDDKDAFVSGIDIASRALYEAAP